MWTTSLVPPPGTNAGSYENGLQFSTSTDGSVTGIRFYKPAADTGTHTGNLWSPVGVNLATVTFTGETASGWQTAMFPTPVAITTGQTYTISVFSPAASLIGDFWSAPYVNSPLTGIQPTYAIGAGYPVSNSSTNTYVDLLLQVGAAAPTDLAGALLESDTLTANLSTSASLTAALVETDTVTAMLRTFTALAVALLELDTVAVALASGTTLRVALLEGDTVGAALSITGAPLTATLALVPTSGIIPFTVTATCTATGGGATKSYAWTWGDGTTTAAGPSNVATHLVTSSGIYTTSCTVV